jgi:hypothetical protein
MIAATIVGKPRFFEDEQIEEIRSLKALKDRRKIMESTKG